jgi:hypothetical protein
LSRTGPPIDRPWDKWGQSKNSSGGILNTQLASLEFLL